jgi:RNA polymerase sigma-70 factor (ECF subfamily)
MDGGLFHWSPGMSEAAAVARTAGDAPSDEEVVRRVRAGEPELFEILMRRHNQRLYRVARSIVRNEAEAEDVMQQAYVNAYTHLDQYADRARFSTWLTRIAVHEALGRLRRRRRVREVDVSSETEETGVTLTSAEPSPEQQALTGELRRLLEGAVDALPSTSRSAFVLREVEGLSTAEAAECLGVSEDVVKTRLHRARRLLRKELFDRAGLVRQDAFAFHASRCDRVVAAVFARLTLPPPAH